MILLVIGLLGFAMRRYGLPVVPAIIAVILGPRAEQQLRRALQLSNGEVSGLWSTPLAKLIYLVIAIVLLWPLISRFCPEAAATRWPRWPPRPACPWKVPRATSSARPTSRSARRSRAFAGPGGGAAPSG